MEILKKIYNNVNYLDNESSFFALNNNLFIDFKKMAKDLSLKEFKQVLDNIEINHGFTSKWFQENFFDADFKIKQIKDIIDNQIKEVDEAIKIIEDFNNFIDYLNDNNINDLQQIAIEITEQDINISNFYLVNREQGLDDVLDELYNYYKDAKKKIEFNKELDKKLSQATKTTKKLKI